MILQVELPTRKSEREWPHRTGNGGPRAIAVAEPQQPLHDSVKRLIRRGHAIDGDEHIADAQEVVFGSTISRITRATDSATRPTMSVIARGAQGHREVVAPDSGKTEGEPRPSSR